MVSTTASETLADLGGLLDKAATLGDAAKAGEELFGVAKTLRSEPGLRRVVTDTSVDEDAKAELANNVFGKAVGEVALAVVTEAVRRRWTVSSELPAVIQQLGVVALVRSAGARSDKITDELFSLGRLIEANPELRGALADSSRPTEDKVGLLRGLLDGKVLPATLTLVEYAVGSATGSVERAISDFQQVAADVQGELLATVRAARELSDDDRTRLSEALGRQYGRDVRLRMVLEPDLVGGLRIEIGDDVIDGTVSGRLDDARRRLAG
ncbi:MAG TPA: F0F1 ATP synthase subunit delta [Nocardioides sp.]|nr:F0F1 ATP synthase subunit delta [Nocardioides sp.]